MRCYIYIYTCLCSVNDDDDNDNDGILSVLVCMQQGIKSVPRRMRIQISRKRNDDEDAKVRCTMCIYHFAPRALCTCPLCKQTASVSCSTAIATAAVAVDLSRVSDAYMEHGQALT